MLARFREEHEWPKQLPFFCHSQPKPINRHLASGELFEAWNQFKSVLGPWNTFGKLRAPTNAPNSNGFSSERSDEIASFYLHIFCAVDPPAVDRMDAPMPVVTSNAADRFRVCYLPYTRPFRTWFSCEKRAAIFQGAKFYHTKLYERRITEAILDLVSPYANCCSPFTIDFQSCSGTWPS